MCLLWDGTVIAMGRHYACRLSCTKTAVIKSFCQQTVWVRAARLTCAAPTAWWQPQAPCTAPLPAGVRGSSPPRSSSRSCCLTSGAISALLLACFVAFNAPCSESRPGIACLSSNSCLCINDIDCNAGALSGLKRSVDCLAVLKTKP